MRFSYNRNFDNFKCDAKCNYPMKYKCNEFGCNGYPYVYGIEDPIGVKGATGAQGPPGAQGPQGVAGVTGAPGPQGEIGPQGVAGVTGATGPQGEPAGHGRLRQGSGRLPVIRRGLRRPVLQLDPRGHRR